jgi:hypothetical protein
VDVLGLAEFVQAFDAEPRAPPSTTGDSLVTCMIC